MQAEQEQTRQDQQQAAGGSGDGKTSARGLGGAHSKAQVISAGITYGLGQIASGLSAYGSAGATHTFRNAAGESREVNSSERARQAGRGIAAVLAVALPAVGGILGNIVGDEIGRRIDKARDAANERTRVA